MVTKVTALVELLRIKKVYFGWMGKFFMGEWKFFMGGRRWVVVNGAMFWVGRS